MRFDTSVKTKPEVTVLGPDVPEELIYAAGARPYWLLGGSLGSVAWSDDLVPRDADPVSRSVLGFIHQPDGPDFSDSLFIVPLTSDSMRKIAYELKNDGRKLCLLDVPPERSDCWALEKWQTQMIRMMAAVAEHTKTHVTRRRVVNCRKMVVRARKTLAAFLELSREKETIFTASARMLVAGSYYYADDLRDWTEHLRMLMEELREQSARILPEDDHPGVLLMGSPVLFPNYKIPLLIHEIGLDIRAVADETALKLEETDTKRIFGGGRDKVIRAIARQRYQHDASSAFVHNDALYHHVQSLLKRGDIEGVVYHVLKGQIEYDFELERFESLFAAHGIPVFRLETDYQYQDVEQLRIRMEAFSEMLRQNRYRKGK
jgi:benzoyl-CoA reductase/2-hydroxyglutaryl-CoA dehydratase subunit BcrC/BadD/HgdB